MKTVFCDESGFTGNNLWQADQPFFVYAAVSIDPDEAADMVESIRRNYRIQSTELHAIQLLKHDNGKRAIIEIVESLVQRSSVVFFHKRYSLAAKMFEYLIEPAISDGNSMFYNIGFHKFVANSLYLALLFEPNTTERTFIAFQDVMRTGDVSKLDAMAEEIYEDGLAGFLGQISTFVTCNREALNDEIAASQAQTNIPRWMLELSSTALMSLLSSLSGKEMCPLSVTCDESKPLLNQAGMFDALIGRTDYHAVEFDGRVNQITFNLAHRIKLGNSKTIPGLQLADVVAGAAAFSLKKPTDEFSEFWRTSCAETLHGNSVIPDLDEIDLATERAIVNACVLNELVDRSVRGENLLCGMRQFIEMQREIAPLILLEQGEDVAP